MRVDVSATPAVARMDAANPLTPMPLPGQAHLAQYNEIAVAGSLWSLVHVLGSNVPAAGFATLLDALKAFNDRYHAPRDMREVRDALTEFADGGNEALQQQIGNAFDDHRLRWGFHFEEIAQTVDASVSGWVVPWAVGAFCDMPRAGAQNPVQSPGDAAFVGPIGLDPNGVRIRHGQVQVHGPLTHTRHDECWETIRGRWLDGNASVLYSLIGTLPYRLEQAHRNGRTVLGVVFRCASRSGDLRGCEPDRDDPRRHRHLAPAERPVPTRHGAAAQSADRHRHGAGLVSAATRRPPTSCRWPRSTPSATAARSSARRRTAAARVAPASRLRAGRSPALRGG